MDVILNSGGLDSAVVLSLVTSMQPHKQNILAVNFIYSQQNSRGVASAKKIADYYKVEYVSQELDLSWPQMQTLDTFGKPRKLLKLRNLVFVANLIPIIAEFDSVRIWGGWNADDFNYPDAQVGFLNALQKTFQAGEPSWDVQIMAPWLYLTKNEIVGIGLKLQTPFQLTWSCHNKIDKPCGTCDSCIQRNKAFASYNLVDPLIKEDN